MKPITVGVVYFNQPEMLKQHFKEWVKYQDGVEFIVVDDCSKAPPVVSLDFVKIYRILDDIPWNQTGARNLLHYVAENEWVVSTDCDHVVTHDAFKKISELPIDDELRVFFLNRKFSHSIKKNKMHSSFYCNRYTFLAVGGHDEDLAGRYGAVDQSWECKVRKDLNYDWREDICVENHSFNPEIKDANVAGLSRDPKVNMRLLNFKLRNGQPRGSILRFRWERIK
jgi:hypothetical protein